MAADTSRAMAPDSVSLNHHQPYNHRLSSYSLDRRNRLQQQPQQQQMDARSLAGHLYHHNQQHRLSSYSLDRRNKYSTLTPLEAKRLSYHFSSSSSSNGHPPSRPPLRTASVRNKPRPPPMLVTTNLDDLSLNRHQQQQQQQAPLEASQIAPIAPIEYRLANTVGLATPALHHHHHQQPPPYCDEPDRGTDLEESFASAKSHHSDSGTTTTIMKSLSKVSLVSTSTYKAFAKCNIKKFFRYMPTRRSLNSNNGDNTIHPHTASDNGGHLTSELPGANRRPASGLSESLSQLCLSNNNNNAAMPQAQSADSGNILYSNYGEITRSITHANGDLRSQSPATVFPPPPPPPRELKSMSYMDENKVSYSNYDEFTRMRNQQTSNLLNNHHNHHHHVNAARARYGCVGGGGGGDETDGSSDDAWQLTSLPVYYERNLATVFEEKRYSNKNTDIYNNNNNNNDRKDMIKPPSSFDDGRTSSELPNHSDNDATPTTKSNNNNNTGDSMPITDSTQSLASADSLLDLDYHRQALVRTNMGLPPKMPMNGIENKPSSSCATTSSDSSVNEHEHLINNLKAELTHERKKITDLELKLWSAEHQNDQLASANGRLEKENAQLRAQLASCLSRLNL